MAEITDSTFQKYIEQVRGILRKEGRRLMVFGVIGITALGLTIGLYALVSRVLFPNGQKTLEYTLVSIFVTWLNYEANRHFTFQKAQRNIGSVGRFTAVAAAATGLNALLFWLGHEVMHIPDLLMIIINAAIVAFFTFTLHRLFTFHEQPWRFVERFRRQ